MKRWLLLVVGITLLLISFVLIREIDFERQPTSAQSAPYPIRPGRPPPEVQRDIGGIDAELPEEIYQGPPEERPPEAW